MSGTTEEKVCIWKKIKGYNVANSECGKLHTLKGQKFCSTCGGRVEIDKSYTMKGE